MRVCAGLPGVQLAPLSRFRSTSRTRDGLDLFASERFADHNVIATARKGMMVNIEHFPQLQTVCGALRDRRVTDVLVIVSASK